MRRNVFLLCLATTVVVVVWHSRSIWNNTSSTSSVVHLLDPGQRLALGSEIDSVEQQEEAAEAWLQWNAQASSGSWEQSSQLSVKDGQSKTGGMMVTLVPTEILMHASGNTVFSNLYVYRGVIYIVTDNAISLPELKHITSNGAALNTDYTNPSEKDIRVVSLRDAETLFGGPAASWEGTSWIITEHPEFIAHYYHYTAEILLSLQRTTSALNGTLPTLARLLFPHSTPAAFRDSPGMNAYVSLAAFPHSQLLFSDTWRDLNATKRAYKLERAVLFDRAAAMRGPEHGRTWKPISEAMSLPTLVEDWWGEVRERVVGFAGGEVARPGSSQRKKVVTYVSRQRGKRRTLRAQDHKALVRALREASTEMGFELNVVQLEGMSKAEQIQLAARTTVLMGVHGNGLTSLVWMRPSPHSAIFEFFMPGGWFRDYEITARSLGMMYRGFWNDTSFSYPGFQGRDVAELHSTQIPVHAPYVVSQLKQALSYGLGEHVLAGS
ncbi:hypothetical protein CALCODRAFT_447436 [Calocera cornea HHB12733]|uniref:Glycosyltransferase 61 catalytic domain-containing protein n=1 Tax=Calocera cornea HHB12733 TaxID=1353952 RepID=A0A165J7J4_9BASI|nr:hypothetical protein CALCODRAFT_447436 [Calocera cornea HHB12733]